jgi:diguanylate cyclase (GGDEF)-like protein
MLWRKKKSVDVAAAADDAPLSEEPARAVSDKALDTVTHVVRLYGKHAFDTDMADASSIEASCDEWATRISLGGPRSHASDAPKGGAPAPRAGGFRDWTGLVSFIRDQRRAESDYVVRSMGNFRDAILSFATCLGKTIAEERETDARLDQRIDVLKRAIDQRDTALIVAEASHVVDAVREAMSSRREREVEEVRLLGQHVRDLRAELSEVRKKAQIDALTQLSNRAAFDAHVVQLVSLGVLLGDCPWLMLVDLDHFKAINDTYGHPAGDEVLRQVSQCLSRTFLRKQDFVSRYGGEEFAAVLLDTTEQQMISLALRLLECVRKLVVPHGKHEMRVTLSVGLAALRPNESSESWIARADGALYRAKREGRDGYRIER